MAHELIRQPGATVPLRLNSPIDEVALARARVDLAACLRMAARLGLAIGLSVSARASVPIAHLVYFPLAFLGGLWLPPSMLPDIVNQISLLTPTRHYAELAWNAIADGPLPLIHWAWLLGWGVAFGWVALVAWRRDRGRRFV